MGFFDDIVDTISSPFRAVGDVAGTVFRGAVDIGKGAIDFGKNAVDWTKNAIKDTAETAYGLGKGIVNKLDRATDAGVGFLENLSKFFSGTGFYWILGIGGGLILLYIIKK